MEDSVRSMDARELGYIADFDGRTPMFVYIGDGELAHFNSLEDHESVQVGERYFTCGGLRQVLGCFVPKEEYESMMSVK